MGRNQWIFNIRTLLGTWVRLPDPQGQESSRAGLRRALPSRPMSHRIAIVTSGPGRPFDDDLPPLVAALEQVGATVEVLDWDDDGADWGRSTSP